MSSQHGFFTRDSARFVRNSRADAAYAIGDCRGYQQEERRPNMMHCVFRFTIASGTFVDIDDLKPFGMTMSVNNSEWFLPYAHDIAIEGMRMHVVFDLEVAERRHSRSLAYGTFALHLGHHVILFRARHDGTFVRLPTTLDLRP